MSAARAVLWLMLVTAVIRVVVASTTGLGIDESYMVAAGRTLQLSYFDHPPLSWWLFRLASIAAGSDAPVVVRLPFIALFAASTWLMFAWTSRLFGRRAGVWAAVALNLSPVFGVTTAMWVLPDGPLVCALLAGGWALTRALEAGPSPRPAPGGRGGSKDGLLPLPLGESLSWLLWAFAGLSAGLALLSKYSAGLVLAGAFLYLLTQPTHRRWLLRPHPYVAVLIAAACCAPVVLWNMRHGWASFAFQGGRAASTTIHPFGPLATLGGEALFLLPWIWLPLMLGWIAALRAGPAAWKTWLPACLGAGPVVLFVVVSLWARHVLFHWAAPGYLMLFPLLGLWAERAWTTRPRLIRLGLRGTAALVGVALAVLVADARWNLLAPFGVDPGFQATDWTPLRADLLARGLLDRPNTVIAATSWQDTGKLDYGLGGAVPVICLSPDARQYGFLPGPGFHRGEDVLIIGPKLTAERLGQTYGAVLDRIEALPPLRLRGMPIPVFLGRHLAWPGG